MSRIRIKNFGPIKEGNHEDDGWLDIKKVTVFIGNQGSGKSTIAKLISTLTWIEKAMNRGDAPGVMSRSMFEELFKYQRLSNYFNEKTEIEFKGARYHIKFNPSKDFQNTYPVINRIDEKDYVVPKIMYVPSERNFLSVIKDANSVRGLPAPLFEFAEELRKSQETIGNNGVELPINSVFYKFDAVKEIGIIFNSDYSIDMLSASSGFQSLVPLYLVSRDLAYLISKGKEDLNSDILSVNQKLKVNQAILRIMNSNEFSNDKKISEIEKVKSNYISKCFINIVEEPEQNLFPSSQHKILNSLLEFNNMNEGNKLIMTTHSPYLINYLTLAVKAKYVEQELIVAYPKYKLHSSYGLATDNEVNGFQKIFNIVPKPSMLESSDLVIYELDEKDGSIKKLPDYKGLPSDENYLNSNLENTNELFAQLQEIERGWR